MDSTGRSRPSQKRFALTAGSGSTVTVTCGSSTLLELQDDSVDYVFTDPPFGGYIPYAEINQLNEAWLGRLTDRTQEAIVSPAQEKSVSDYAQLMTDVFSQVSRVLKPDGQATVVFHASKPAVWDALGDAFRINSFSIKATSILDKQQVSFKQVVSEGGTRDDAIFLLTPISRTSDSTANLDFRDVHATVEVAIVELEEATNGHPEELTPRRMWSRYVAACLEAGTNVAVDAPGFYAILDRTRGEFEQQVSSAVG